MQGGMSIETSSSRSSSYPAAPPHPEPRSRWPLGNGTRSRDSDMGRSSLVPRAMREGETDAGRRAGNGDLEDVIVQDGVVGRGEGIEDDFDGEWVGEDGAGEAEGLDEVDGAGAADEEGDGLLDEIDGAGAAAKKRTASVLEVLDYGADGVGDPLAGAHICDGFCEDIELICDAPGVERGDLNGASSCTLMDVVAQDGEVGRGEGIEEDFDSEWVGEDGVGGVEGLDEVDGGCMSGIELICDAPAVERGDLNGASSCTLMDVVAQDGEVGCGQGVEDKFTDGDGRRGIFAPVAIRHANLLELGRPLLCDLAKTRCAPRWEASRVVLQGPYRVHAVCARRTLRSGQRCVVLRCADRLGLGRPLRAWEATTAKLLQKNNNRLKTGSKDKQIGPFDLQNGSATTKNQLVDEGDAAALADDIRLGDEGIAAALADDILVRRWVLIGRWRSFGWWERVIPRIWRGGFLDDSVNIHGGLSGTAGWEYVETGS
ncbi:hypothetical protein K438DRAFT_1763180 [Mycena galopus ATCC 62051]|nr:hypothetical protein K438DRAFT_1763180 [Mycena galopus ATCC 62051]